MDVSSEYFHTNNLARPHQGIEQQIPEVGNLAALSDLPGQPVGRYPVLGGLHHDYRRVA